MAFGSQPNIERLFLEALEQPPSDRDAFLREACCDDAELHRSVKACLEAHARAGAWLTAPAGVELRRLLDSRQHADQGSDGDETLEAWNELLGRIGSRDAFESRYRSRKELARGGMGAILRVFDENLRRELAMKVILDKGSDLPREALTLGRFLEEAQVTAQLDHPGIVPVHELGVDATGKVYFTMKLVQGEDLSAVFEKVKRGEEGWSLVRALNVLLRSCEAMGFAHARGVVHRDLKPANIMVGRFGETYVMDWGLARVLERDDTRDLRLQNPVDHAGTVMTDRMEQAGAEPNSPLVTMDGHVIGTPVYMAPEQAEGRLERIGPQTDVYGMGAILYQLLTGQMPYTRPDVQASPHRILRWVLDGPPQPVHSLNPDIPAELIAICERAMARDSTRRYGTMVELAQDLRAYLENRVVAAYESGPLAELKKWVRRNRGIAATAAVALVLLSTVLWWSFNSIETERDVAKDNEKTALAERNRADARKAEFDQLAGVVLLETALRKESELYPAWPEKIAAMETWLREDAAPLVALKPTLRKTLEGLEGRSIPRSSPADPVRFAGESEQFLFDTLTDVSEGIEAFESGTRRDVEERLTWALQVDDLTRDHPNAIYSWEEAREAIAAADGVLASELYADDSIDLVPQLGLVPIGMNPVTLLWEFYHLRSAHDPSSGMNPAEIAIPEHREDGALEIGAETGLVFVLIPGGAYRIGAQSTDPAAPHYDPLAELRESPVHEIVLEPYFLSRYELTQGQWRRLTGENPSVYGPEGDWSTEWDSEGREANWTHPVEEVSWEDCMLHLPRFGLRLPSEGQWEAACRAGTETPWWTGNNASDLDGAGNLADRYGKTHGQESWSVWEEDLDDGSTVHSRVGRYRANAFGLHDVLGNVWEWCLDDYANYRTVGRNGDGARFVEGATTRVARGGCFGSTTRNVRSTFRSNDTPSHRNAFLGCRPARGIQVD